MKEIDYTAFIQEWKLNLETSAYLRKLDKKNPLKKKNWPYRQEFPPKLIIEDMKWFPLQGNMLHASDNIEFPAENLELFLKVISMFNIRIIYDETIDKEDVQESFGILYINC